MNSELKERLSRLINLAKRPGTEAEGRVAKDMATKMSIKYNLPCEFTIDHFKLPRPAEPQKALLPDQIFEQYIKSLKSAQWNLFKFVDTKVGLQARFFRSGTGFEVRVTQRKNSDLFDSEIVSNPFPDQEGKDNSYISFMCTNLPDLMKKLKVPDSHVELHKYSFK